MKILGQNNKEIIFEKLVKALRDIRDCGYYDTQARYLKHKAEECLQDTKAEAFL